MENHKFAIYSRQPKGERENRQIRKLKWKKPNERARGWEQEKE